MLRDFFKPMSGAMLAVGTLICTAASSLALPTAAAAEEITITVTKFHALDKADDLSAGDFFARMRVGGKAAFSPVQSGQQEFKPNWKLKLPIASGKQSVNLALIDKDVAVDDPIDINRVDGKRDLDFTVDTKTCRIEGFSETYKCGQVITRSGAENKKAAISFTVEVKK